MACIYHLHAYDIAHQRIAINNDVDRIIKIYFYFKYFFFLLYFCLKIINSCVPKCEQTYGENDAVLFLSLSPSPSILRLFFFLLWPNNNNNSCENNLVRRIKKYIHIFDIQNVTSTNFGTYSNRSILIGSHEQKKCNLFLYDQHRLPCIPITLLISNKKK